MHTRRRILITAAGASLSCATAAPKAPPRSASPAAPTRPRRTFVLAVQGFMDPNTEAVVRELWREMAEVEISDTHTRPGARPHMTLASWNVAEVGAKVKAELQVAAAALAPQPVRLRLQWAQHGRDAGIYLVPSADDQDLFAFHQRFHDLFGSPGQAYRPMDQPGQWHPHLSIEYDFPADRLEDGRQICARLPEWLDARIEHVGLVTFGPLDYPAVFPLSGPLR